MIFSKEKDYMCLFLTDEVLQVCHLKGSGEQKKIIGVNRKDLREVAEEDLPNMIRSTISELNVKKPYAICTIPSNVVTTKNIEIPSLDEEEIRSIIDLQAGRHTPFSREEILVGYINIGIFQRNYTKILLIIVNRNVIKTQLQIFESAGIKVEKVLFAPEGVARFYARVLNVKDEDTPVGIINISSQSTDFIVEFNRTVATCRSIPMGFSQLLKGEGDVQGNLVEEIVRSIEAYQNEDINKVPETYILTGDDAKIKELQPVLRDKLKVNVQITPFLDHVEANQQVMLKMVSEYGDDSFLDIISAAGSFEQMEVDLTPDEIKTQRAIEEKGRQVIKSGIYAFLILMLICAIFFTKLYFRGNKRERLEEEYIQKRKQVIMLDRIAQKTRIIKDYLSTRMVSLDVINELYNLVPDEIYLTNIYMDENGQIDIQGVSDSMSLVFNFVTALEESDMFRKVETKSTTAKKERNKDVAGFQIQFRLKDAKDEAIAEQEAADEEATQAAAGE